MHSLRGVLKDQQGQDLIEYSLLMAIVAIAAIGVVQGMHNGISGIWTSGNTTLANAKAAAS
jgi:Flp pilus assembly pilin Flp